MMAGRLLELQRVLKPTGSLYLHCDPTASHYLKIVLDAVFGKTQFQNEIIWKRQSAHSDAKNRFPNVSDFIFFYQKTDRARFIPQYTEHDETYLKKFYRFDEGDGRGRYRLDNMASPNPRPNMMYEWRGFACPKKGWRYQRETMQKLHDEGRIHYPQKSDGSFDLTKRPALKRYLEEQEGSIITNIWMDIEPLHASSAERMGYPTQKPVALLERIIQASSNEGDVVLDPFCGCGTAVYAAQKLGRGWIGIDITHLAIALIEKRLKDAFPGIGFDVHGTPKDLSGARDLAARDKYQFQWWVCSLVNAQPYQGHKKGADGGIDGLIYFQDEPKAHKKIVVSVKGGGNVSVAMVRDLAHVVEREKAAIGLFVTLTEPTQPMLKEAAVAGFYECAVGGKKYRKLQILTVSGLLDGTERLEYLDLSAGITFKKAARENKKSEQSPLF
jgi:DNA modification methylase